MKYKWLLFDADGTLFDYETAEINSLKKTFEYNCLPYEQEYLQKYKSINKILWQKFELGQISQKRLKVERFESLIQEIGINTDAQNMSENYLLFLSQQTCLIPGVDDLLLSINNDFNLMLITNGIAKVQRPRFNNSILKNYFNGIIISEEVGSAKPDTKIFEKAFEEMGSPDKSEVLMLGDSLSSDIKGGINYGIDTCWVNLNNNYNSLNLDITFIVNDLDELRLKLLK